MDLKKLSPFIALALIILTMIVYKKSNSPQMTPSERGSTVTTSEAQVSQKANIPTSSSEKYDEEATNITAEDTAKEQRELAAIASSIRRFETHIASEHKRIVSKRYTEKEFKKLFNGIFQRSYKHPEDLMASYLDLRNKIMLSATDPHTQNKMFKALDKGYAQKSKSVGNPQYKGFTINSGNDGLKLKLNR